MRGDEDLALDCRVHPLPAAGSAANEVAVVDEDAPPELDGNVAEGEDGGEEQVGIHLLAEEFLAQVVLLVVPMLMTELAIIDRFFLNFVIVIILGFNDNDAAFGEEVVPPASDDHMEDKVDDKEHGGPVEAGRVDFSSRACGAKARDEGKDEREGIEDVHRAEVPLRALSNGLARLAGHVGEDLVEADEAEVVRGDYEDPVPGDVLRRHVECNQTGQLDNITLNQRV